MGSDSFQAKDVLLGINLNSHVNIFSADYFLPLVLYMFFCSAVVSIWSAQFTKGSGPLLFMHLLICSFIHSTHVY